MISHVPDASSFGPLLLEDEAAGHIAVLSEALAEERCIVPPHWRFEAANMILVALRRKRIAPQHAHIGFQLIEEFAIPVDPDSTTAALSRTFDLAQRYQLTIYDAAYLELAKRRDLILVTLDGELIDAARAEAVEVVSL